MTPERLTELRALADAATPGPWTVYEYGDDSNCYGVESDYTTADGWQRIHDTAFQREGDDASDIVDCDRREQNATFIAAARTAVPELLAEAERLRAIVAAVDELHQPITVEDGDGETVICTYCCYQACFGGCCESRDVRCREQHTHSADRPICPTRAALDGVT